jgi:hypothetical protein
MAIGRDAPESVRELFAIRVVRPTSTKACLVETKLNPGCVSRNLPTALSEKTMQEGIEPNKPLPICNETIFSPGKRLIKNPSRLAQLAEFYKNLDLSGDDTMDWILEQIYVGHNGTLIDFNGYEIDKAKWFVEELFAEEPRRWINDFKPRATKTAKQRLQEKCVNRVMAMYFARDIYLARTV